MEYKDVLASARKISNGGPGSGCRGDNCGRPSVGQRAHLGFAGKGGVGYFGVLKKIEGGKAHVENDEGRTFVAPERYLSGVATLPTLKGVGATPFSTLTQWAGGNEGHAYILDDMIRMVGEGENVQQAFLDAAENQNFHGDRADIRLEREKVARIVEQKFGVQVYPHFDRKRVRNSYKDVVLAAKLSNGGPGSGCRGDNCGRPSTGGGSGNPNDYANQNPFRKKVQTLVDGAGRVDDGALEDYALAQLQSETRLDSLDKMFQGAVDLNNTPIKNAITTRQFQIRDAARRNPGGGGGAAPRWPAMKDNYSSEITSQLGTKFKSYKSKTNVNGTFHEVVMKPGQNRRTAAREVSKMLAGLGVPKEKISTTSNGTDYTEFQVSTSTDRPMVHGEYRYTKNASGPHYFSFYEHNGRTLVNRRYKELVSNCGCDTGCKTCAEKDEEKLNNDSACPDCGKEMSGESCECGYKKPTKEEAYKNLTNSARELLANKDDDDAGGVWRTVRGRAIFIKDGQSLNDALKSEKGGDKDYEGKRLESINKSIDEGRRSEEVGAHVEKIRADNDRSQEAAKKKLSRKDFDATEPKNHGKAVPGQRKESKVAKYQVVRDGKVHKVTVPPRDDDQKLSRKEAWKARQKAEAEKQSGETPDQTKSRHESQVRERLESGEVAKDIAASKADKAKSVDKEFGKGAYKDAVRKARESADDEDKAGAKKESDDWNAKHADRNFVRQQIQSQKQFEDDNPDVMKKFAAIAKEHMQIDELKERKSDSLDFHDSSVNGVRSAIEAAHKLGGGSGISKKDALRIAAKHLGFETLKERRRDSLDFRDVGVTSLRRAMREAYESAKSGGGKSKVPDVVGGMARFLKKRDKLANGGAGSGCRGDNCGRPSTGRTPDAVDHDGDDNAWSGKDFNGSVGIARHAKEDNTDVYHVFDKNMVLQWSAHNIDESAPKEVHAAISSEMKKSAGVKTEAVDIPDTDLPHTTNPWGGKDYAGRNGTARISLDDNERSVFVLDKNGVLQWGARRISQNAPQSMVDAILRVAKRSVAG